ncbi:hypothetical protein MTR67_007958 [Solanum verrucosum]|uniref:Uncharacterized protein n=1 Tax=Solanum verrucosum TaxID=315347 RepID=A0AAF0TG03_SOLVR|nr:hypothetical protein MTR67_007958 [Solanum verrucosum]
MISVNAPRCFDDLLTSERTWSSAEYAYLVSYVVQLEKLSASENWWSCSILHQSEATRLFVRWIIILHD